MKHNSRIVFHLTRKLLTIGYRLLAVIILAPFIAGAAEKPEYLQSFDPAKGWKPAQRDLTEIFLQIAGSLEEYGSPEPYLTHMIGEHERISALYFKKFGKAPKALRPAYLTDDYIGKLAGNWKLLSPKLGLAKYAKEFGSDMRDAIKGTRGTGTIIVDIFNQHQKQVAGAMSRTDAVIPGFEILRSQLEDQLELNKASVNEERYQMARRDAISFALGIKGSTNKLFGKIDKGLKPEAAESVKTVLTSTILDTGMMAHSELQAGIIEEALSNR